jgi:hypothetical protein
MRALFDQQCYRQRTQRRAGARAVERRDIADRR